MKSSIGYNLFNLTFPATVAVKTNSASLKSISEMLVVLKSDKSIPCFLHASIAYSYAFSPEYVENPADDTSISEVIFLNITFSHWTS